MTICHVITAFGFGGAEKLLVDLVNIQSREHQVHIIYLKGEPHIQVLLDPEVHLHKIPLSVQCPIRLRELIRKIQADIVHTHVGHADLIGMLACTGLPVKLFCTKHNTWFKRNWKDYIIFFFYALFFNTIGRKCKVISISKAVSEHLRKVLHVPETNIRLIYNAIPDSTVAQDKMDLRRELSIAPDAFCVLFVGRLEIPKSIDTLLQAIPELTEKIPGLQVLLVGEGSLQKKLQQLATTLRITDVVRFEGQTPYTEKYYQAADIVVLPSIFEGFGIVIIEAFRASIPVVASNIEGPKELIQNESNGLLFEPKDHKALSAQVMKLYSRKEWRIQMGQNGYKSYLNKYDMGSYAKQVEALYNE